MISRVTIYDRIADEPRVSTWTVTSAEGHVGAAYAAWVQAFGKSPLNVRIYHHDNEGGRMSIECVRVCMTRVFLEERPAPKRRSRDLEQRAAA